MTWELSPNAVSYTVSLTGNHGHQVQCTSNTTTCSAKLDCGRQYTAVIVATSATCDSIPAAPLTFDSGKTKPSSFLFIFTVHLFIIRTGAIFIYFFVKHKDTTQNIKLEHNDKKLVWIDGKNNNKKLI